jgi:SAM-dependent methyltransferase
VRLEPYDEAAAGTTSLYDDPLVYDVLFAPGTTGEVDALERIAGDWVRTRGGARTWLEPACGPGRYLRVLARRGYAVIGFDRNSAMIAFARRRVAAVWRGPRARAPRLFVADMTDFDLGRRRADFAFNLFNTIRHLDSDAAMQAHFAAMARALRPGGVYAVGLSTSLYGREPMDEDVWEARRGGLRARQTVQYLPPGVLEERPPSRAHRRLERVVSHVRVERRGRRAEHRDSTYDLRCYDEGQWRRLVARSALVEIGAVDSAGRRIAPATSSYAIRLLVRRSDPPRPGI